MKARITANQLADLLAGEMDLDPALARNFVTALFAETAATLEAGRPVTIKGFGEFLTDGTFIPDEALADEVNAPFSAFEPVELAPEVTEEMLSAESQPAAIKPQPVPQPEPESEPEPPAEPEAEPESEPEPEPAPLPAAVPPPVAEPAAAPAVNPPEYKGLDNSTESNAADYDYLSEYDPDKKSNRTTMILTAFIFTAIGFALGVIATMLFMGRSEASEKSAEVEIDTSEYIDITDMPDSTFTAPAEAPAIETAANATAVTDTVKAGYYFTMMARRHYGDKSFWVYIYEENAASKGFTHPERVAPGTVVTVPPREKYGIDPDNPESVKAAKQKAQEIYSRSQ